MNLEISPIEFKNKFLSSRDDLELIDVREKSEFDQIRIKGSKLISMNELDKKLDQIDWAKDVIFICRTGGRSAYVTEVLRKSGYEGLNLSGGIHILQMNCAECIEKGELDNSYFD